MRWSPVSLCGMDPRQSLEGGGSAEQRLSDEHRGLHGFFARTRQAVLAEDESLAMEAFEALHEELEAHFAREDRLYFPPLWSLRPACKPGLLQFMNDHEVFRVKLVEILERIRSGALGVAGRELDELVAAFAIHERREEDLVSGLFRS